MDKLAYQAKLTTEPENNLLAIGACNCIYDGIAHKHREICEFDKSLLPSLMDCEVELIEWLAKGDHICKFNIIDPIKE